LVALAGKQAPETMALVASSSLTHSLPLVASAASGGGGAINIDLDLTFTLQMLLFLVLIVALKPLLFDPVLKIFEERERRTDGARDDARAMQKRAGELLRRYEDELVRVNRTAAQERDRIRLETAKLEAEILGEARQSTSKIIDLGRAEIDKQVQEIRFELGRRSERLAHDIASRALGRELS
jgi:F-type H+-transporting ATPase subunit b